MTTRPGARPSAGTIFLWIVVLAVAVLAGAWVVLNANAIIQSFWPPSPATSQGRAIHDLYTIVFLIAAVIFFVVEGLIVWTVIRYRRRPGDDELPPQTHGHNLAEIVWTIVPTIIVIFLFFVSWQTLNTVEATAAQPDLKVRAHAGQFQWTFDYLPADAVTGTEDPVFTVTAPMAPDGGLTLPAGKTTHLFLTSNDVIHAFYVPHFLFKRDVVPGHINQFDLSIDADEAGQVFRGQCAELCGTGHRIMIFDVNAMDPAAFQAWYDQKVVEASQTPPPPPSGEPGGSGEPPQGGGPVVDVTAHNIQFVQTSIEAPADQPWTIHFDNQDQAPHDVDIADSSGKVVADNKDFVGPGTKDYQIPPLTAGTYGFHCSIHTNMTGTLTVQ